MTFQFYLNSFTHSGYLGQVLLSLIIPLLRFSPSEILSLFSPQSGISFFENCFMFQNHIFLQVDLGVVHNLGSRCIAKVQMRRNFHYKIYQYSTKEAFINICQHQSSQQQHVTTSINIVIPSFYLVSELVSLCLQRQHSQHKQHVTSSINTVISSSFLVSELVFLCQQRHHSQHRQHASSKLSK